MEILMRPVAAVAIIAVIAGLPLPSAGSPRTAAGAGLSSFSSCETVGPSLGQEIREVREESAWPPPSPNEWYWHRPNETLTQPQIDASLAGIKSGMFWSVTNDWKGPLRGVSASRKRIQFAWLDGATSKESYFPPKLLGSMRLYYATPQSQGQKWLVVVNLTTQGVIQAYFETEGQARAFIDAAASVAKAAGIELEDKGKRGFAVSDLTPAQAQALGKSRIDSALVSMIAYGGPADQAGLRYLDLITEVDGVKVRNADHFVSILDAAPPGAELELTCLERVEETVDGAPARVWKPRTVVWKQAPRP